MFNKKNKDVNQDACFLSKQETVDELANWMCESIVHFFGVISAEVKYGYMNCKPDKQKEFVGIIIRETQAVSASYILIEKLKYYCAIYNLNDIYSFASNILSLIKTDLLTSILIYERSFFGRTAVINEEEIEKICNLNDSIRRDLTDYFTGLSDSLEKFMINRTIDDIQQLHAKYKWIELKYQDQL